MKPILLSVLLSFFAFVHTTVFGLENQNLGYEIEVLSHETLPSFAEMPAGDGYAWFVLNASIRNRIDPFLVFDFGVDEKIQILSLQDRAFLVAGDGSLYRLEPELFGKEGHFPRNIQLKSAGSKVTGQLAFKVKETPVSCELHWIDESFAPIVVSVDGKLPDELLPSNAIPQENEFVSLAVGEHGPVTIEGQRAATGMQFYSVDLWGRSKFKRTVPVYYLEEAAADPKAMAEADFYFEYKKSDMLLHLVAEDAFSYVYRPDLSLGESIQPAYVSKKWTRSRLIFEIPKDASDLRLEALFGKMGLSEGKQLYLDGLVFPLYANNPKSLPHGEAVNFKDAIQSNELSLSVALTTELDPWNADGDQWLGLWVRIENTGAEAGVIEPSSRFWFEGSGDRVYPVDHQPGNRYAPPKHLYLDKGHPRSFLLLFERERLIRNREIRLCYSGIGNYREMEVDWGQASLALLDLEAITSRVVDASDSIAFGDTVEPPVKDARSDATVSNPKAASNSSAVTAGGKRLPVPSLSSVPQEKSTSQSKSPAHPKAKPATSEPIEKKQESEKFLAAYEQELPPALSYENTISAANAAIGEMSEIPFVDLLKPSLETFEPMLGAVAIAETESNEDWDAASIAMLNQTCMGTIQTKDEDFWKIHIPSNATGKDVRFDLYFNFPTDIETLKGLYCTLFDQNKKQIVHAWMETGGSYPLRNLNLTGGDYYILVKNYGEQPDAKYLFQLRSMTHPVTLESEPNAQDMDLMSLKRGETVQGVLGNRDHEDFYKWIVDASVSEKNNEFLILSDQPTHSIRFTLYDEKGETQYTKDGKGQFAIGDMSPVPGTYFVRITCGEDKPTRYHLQWHDLGNRLAGWEHEPNDEISSPSIVAIDQIVEGQPELLGRLDGVYGDFFSVHVTDKDSLYHLTVAGPRQVQLSYFDKRRGKLATAWSTKDAPAFLVDLRLPLGLNYFYIDGDEGAYAVNVQKVPIPGETFEWETNDSEGQAQLMQMGVPYYGRLLSNYDDDWYRVVVRQAMAYTFRLKAPDESKLRFHISNDGYSAERQVTTEETSEIVYKTYLLPGDYMIQMEAVTPSLGFYEFRVDADPTPADAIEAPVEGLEWETVAEAFTASAFNDDFQELVQHVNLSNTGSSTLNLRVYPLSSSIQVKADDDTETSLVLAPGERRSIDITWILEPQLPANEVIEVYVGLRGGDHVEFARARIVPSSTSLADTILPGKQLLSEALAGGFNLNAVDFGAKPVLEPASLYGGFDVPSEDQLEYLIDGALANRSFFGHAAVIKMAGDGSSKLVGTSIDLHGRGNLWESAKDFCIDVSNDGQDFTEIYKGTLQPKTGEQTFVFAKPVTGQFSRLRLLNTQSGKEAQVPHVGEWRMIAEPIQPIRALGHIDLMDEQRGGHRIRNEQRQWVYGFQHNRAARLNSLIWQNKQRSSKTYENPHEVKLEISESSPVGPWMTVGVLDVSAADTEQSLSVEVPLREEPWARFVRISWKHSDTSRYTSDPFKISLIEKPVSADYRSILGEWMGPTQFAHLEYAEKLKGTEHKVELKRVVSSETKPFELEPDIWTYSVAWINEAWEDWYVIDPLKIKKQLQVAVESKPFVKVAVELTDASGKSVPMQEVAKGAHRKEFTFLANPGIRYHLHVFEPKRSIVYLWDVSGSMGRFVESIENAVLKFADAIDSKTEKVQLLPFDEPAQFLTDDWVSDSYELQTIIRNYDAPDSSYAHLNLLAATEALKQQIGTKAAIVITDCESGRGVNDDLWAALEAVKPAVFTFQTSDQTSGYRIEQDDMQDWASVAGGFYHNTRATYELDTAFEKVQAYLRRPAPYRIQLTAPALKPSFITVKDSRDKSTIRNPEKDGVLLIIDASASMRESLPDGQMKVTAAKAVIQNLVEHYLPTGVNFGLRVFGHRGGADCASELMIPVAPLDVEAVKQKLMFVRSSSLGNTALGEALGWAKEDLKDLEGLKRIVVLTDGEETCHGDPAAVIADLAAAGMDVTVNIVGFTLGDEKVKSEYGSWVKSTGGKYFDAQNTEALGVALKEAMTPVELPDFEIYDSAGVLVSSGQVGDPVVEVESGVYSIKILDPVNPRNQTVEAFETSVTIEYR